MYDLIIIGGGPAGITAGIYAARKKIKTLLIAKELGGQPNEAWQIENYPGFGSILGVELAQKFNEHLMKFKDDIEIKEGEATAVIECLNAEFEVTTEKNKYQTKAVLVASGVIPRKLGIPGESEFIGKGVVFCATCDAPLFRGKRVAVVGAGNSGMDAAIQLTKYAEKIYLLNKYPSLEKGDKAYVEQIKISPLIEVLNSAAPKEIKGDKFVASLVWENTETKEEREIEVSGVFVEIGARPNLHFIKNLVEYSERGEIIIDPQTNMTSYPGIFAAGDVTTVPHKQIVIAAGEGAKAALSIYAYLRNKN